MHALRRRAKTFVGTHPQLFFPIFRFRRAFQELIVNKETDICIEGFPRSANSFAVEALRYAQADPIEIAHHTHVPANAMRACKLDIPTAVLIRTPKDAIVSRIALAKETRSVTKESEAPHQRVSFATWLHAWQSFYRPLKPYWERGDLLVVPFSDVIRDMGHVIERINIHFGTNFDPFEHTDETVANVHNRQGFHAGPTDRRAQFKEETRTDFDEFLYTNSSLQEQMDEAERLFNLFTKRISSAS